MNFNVSQNLLKTSKISNIDLLMKMDIYFVLIILFCLVLSCKKESKDQNTIDHGLIAYFPFNGNANDESENNSNLTVNGATLTKDRFGIDQKAYHFNGENSLMEIPNLSYMDTVSYFSISLWLKADEISGESYLLSFRSMENDNSGAHYMCVDKVNSENVSRNGISNCTKTDFSTNCTTSLYNDTVSNLMGNWCHLVFGQKKGISVNDKYHTFLYVNGKKRLEYNYCNGPLSFNYGGIVGSVIYGYYGFFKGDLDDIRIYDISLTEEEIQLLYKLKY